MTAFGKSGPLWAAAPQGPARVPPLGWTLGPWSLAMSLKPLSLPRRRCEDTAPHLFASMKEGRADCPHSAVFALTPSEVPECIAATYSFFANVRM